MHRNFPEENGFWWFETDSLGLDSEKSKMAVFSSSVNDKYIFVVEPK